MAANPPAVAGDGSRQAFSILRFGFTVAPIIAGADKFFHLLADEKRPYVHAVGVVEIIAGLIVAFKPRWGTNFDAIFNQAMMMADTLANGLMKQFPSRFV